MGQLRDRMEQDLKLKGVSPATIRNYLLYCRKFAAFFMRSPEELGAAEVRAFLLHQIEVEQLAYASFRQVYAALKFLYSVTLGRPGEVSRLPFPKHRPCGLPKVLTADELTAFFAAFRKAKYRALFMTCYAAGLRLGEVCHLQVKDIDSRRMVLHVHAGKGARSGSPSCRPVCSKYCVATGGWPSPAFGCFPAPRRLTQSPSTQRGMPFTGPAPKQACLPVTARIACDTVLPLTYSTSAPTWCCFSICWAMLPSEPRAATPTSVSHACSKRKARSTGCLPRLGRGKPKP